ncbi:hypothetical protein [Arundinibacter roseus]|uniref:Uncharacterized protein n=1 Tax=Arundinibacter roseus TaxID=2070510 RepID=A0A4R4KA52_9BACT|nr:hypothetical protein [Arundinibacter roseus]TDB64423.1 hypothetical protein EZE20_12120 [Arundinibacter roseus]
MMSFGEHRAGTDMSKTSRSFDWSGLFFGAFALTALLGAILIHLLKPSPATPTTTADSLLIEAENARIAHEKATYYYAEYTKATARRDSLAERIWGADPSVARERDSLRAAVQQDVLDSLRSRAARQPPVVPKPETDSP